MTETEEGRRLAGLYWRHTAEVLTLLLEHPGLLDEANALVAALQPAVAALLSGQGTNAIITQSMIDQLNSVWTQLVGYASPGLQSNLLAEWARFHGFQDFVDKDFSQWAALLEIPVPAQPWIHLSNPALRDGRFSIRANQVSGVELSLWRSANLTHWERAPASQVQISLVEEYTAELTDLSPPPGRTFYQVRARLLSPGAQTRR